MSILVTGGAGFIGSHTAVELLNAGKEIVIIDNFSNSKPKALDAIKKITGKDFKFYEMNYLDREKLEKVFEENKIDAVLNFAGYKSVGESVKKPLEYYDNNISGCLVLLETMKKYGVKTAQYEIFTDYNLAKEYLQKCDYPIVIKADGLASGKGVVIARTREQAMNTIDDFMILDIFKGAGKSIVIEEFLEGIEASILSITDGKTLIPFISGKDHKQIFDGDKGPNTGGMGVIAPNPFVTEDVMKDFEENIVANTLRGIEEEEFDFKGIIFFGLMITKKGTYLLEYNVRMGDPETQSILVLMESDLVDLVQAALDSKLDEVEVKWYEGSCVNIVLASKGYPEKFEKGFKITIEEGINNKVFLAGAQLVNGELITSGGRVLSLVGKGKTIEEARKEAYKLTNMVDFKGKYFRKDI